MAGSAAATNYPPTVRRKLRPTRAWTVELRKKKPRQEICAPLKWFCFLLNFAGFLVGVTCLALGIYVWTKDPRPISEVTDVVLNPAVVLTACGLAICSISLCGLFGALRDNVCLLKTFALCIFFAYVFLVAITFTAFMLFYTDTSEGISVQSVLLYSIRKYHTNRNVADFVDYIQEQLECCGSAASAGYRDWQMSDQFACNQSNPNPEKCGVPFSCCKRSVVSEAAGSLDPLVGSIRSIQCWQNVQSKREQDLEQDIYLRGCLQPLKILFDKYAIHFGAAVALTIIPICFGVCISQCLARQIDYQRFLLSREERKVERRLRRERRYREQVTHRQDERRRHSIVSITNAQQHPSSSQQPPFAPSAIVDQRKGRENAKRSLPSLPVAQGGVEEAALAAAIEASKRQWEVEERERKRRRTKSSSPMRAHDGEVSRDPAGGQTGSIDRQSPPNLWASADCNPHDLEEAKRRRREKRRRRAEEEARKTSPPGNSKGVPSGPKPLILKQSDFV